jgi:hypothetical protein
MLLCAGSARALGGTLPARVLVLPVMEPTMMRRPGWPLGVSFRSSSSKLASRKCPRWLVPTLNSKPSAVKLHEPMSEMRFLLIAAK